ncbi:MAG TPA: pilus assembly PilX N-terminal domain-containing protein [Vicinamibacterales bacterium]|nr:pilus assembly PilX N-terminal domain-containing protein [Vicinamibacterales bacterium]
MSLKKSSEACRRRLAARAGDERGIALVIALLSTLLMTALGMALMLTTITETMITSNYRDSLEAMYAADAAIERTMQDLLTVPDWNNVLSSANGVTSNVTSSFVTGDLMPKLVDGRTLDLAKATAAVNCPHVVPVPSACTDGQMDEFTDLRPWRLNNPRWRLYAYGPVSDFLPTGTINSPFYVAVWVADDPSENDDNPSQDGNTATNPGRGVIQLRAEAFGPNGAHRIIEATLARTDTTEIERGYIGQRGQDEQNRRARKAAVQTPGKGLTQSQMSLGGGF